LSARLLHLVPLYAVLIGWVGFAAIFVFQRKRSHGKTKMVDRASIIGVVLQTMAFLIVWTVRRRPYMSISPQDESVRLADLPLGLWFEFVAALLAIALVIASLWMMSAAVRVLGKQWSLQARVLEGHALVREGPYRFVRHPIYTGMLGMLIAAGLVHSHWSGFLIAIALYAIGTAIRVRSEEKLLREQFGASYDDYARNVPAVIPFRLAAR
jgi:protein-S-isoprenylcysteine O-methyltransferase Ste14